MGWVVSIVNGSGKHTLLHVGCGQGVRCPYLENPHHIPYSQTDLCGGDNQARVKEFGFRRII